MKKERYFLYLILAVVLVLGIYDLLYYFDVLQIPQKLMLIINIVVPFQFITGGLITTFGIQKQPETFAQRFLILTTFQMLSVIAILVAVWWAAKPDLRIFAFQFLGVFMTIMIVQSALLIRFSEFRD